MENQRTPWGGDAEIGYRIPRMKPTGLAFIVFSLLGAIAGLVAAWYWFKASRVSFELDDFESVDPDIAQNDWIATILTGVTESSDLNAKAARWTAVAVVLGAIATILSVV